MTVLLLARDIANGEPPYGADLIRFVRIDFDNQTVRLIAVPRDLWVATPHLAPLNVDHSRLGLVYYLQEQATAGTSDQIATAATGAVAQALYDNYGVTADHYLFLEMKYFAQALDQLGGLDVNIPAAITVGGIPSRPVSSTWMAPVLCSMPASCPPLRNWMAVGPAWTART